MASSVPSYLVEDVEDGAMKATTILTGIIVLAVVGTAEAKSLFGVKDARLYCNPRDNTARILRSPSPNAIHPDWRGESYIGTGWTIVTAGTQIQNDTGRYLRGNLVSTRGGITARGVYISAREWACSPPPR